MTLPAISKLRNVINRKLVFVDQDMSMSEVIHTMVDKRVSSLLVTDSDGIVVGIITERDVVHKFSLIDLAEKMSAKVITVMTRPVEIVRASHLLEDITRLHFELGIRHFPVGSSRPCHKEDIMGIITVSDLFRFYHSRRHSLPEHVPEAKSSIHPSVLVIAANALQREKYATVFRNLGYQPTMAATVDEVATKMAGVHPPILYDLDEFPFDENLHLLKQLKHLSTPLFLVTSNERLADEFRAHLSRPNQHVALKPLDISYVNWLMTHHDEELEHSNRRSQPA